MSVERDRILFDLRVMLTWLGAALAVIVAIVAMPDTIADLGGGLTVALMVAGGLALYAGIARLRRARLRAGRPVAYAGGGCAPEAEGFVRFAAWLVLCWAWMLPAAMLAPVIGNGGHPAGGWAVITALCGASAMRWMCAPAAPGAHEDELLGFAVGLLAPAAFPLAGLIALSEAPGWWAFVALGSVGAPFALAWQLRRERRLRLGAQPTEALPGGTPA